QFYYQNCLSHAAFEHGPTDRTVLCLIPDRGHKIRGHGCISHRECDRSASDGAAYQCQENMGRFFWRDCFCAAMQPGAVQIEARPEGYDLCGQVIGVGMRVPSKFILLILFILSKDET